LYPVGTTQTVTRHDHRYVFSIEIHAGSPHINRAGRNWHTGSIGWMYCLIIERLDKVIPLLDDRQEHRVEMKIMASLHWH